MIKPSKGGILIGISFFNENSVTLDLASIMMRFQEVTLQQKALNGNFWMKMLELQTSHTTRIQSKEQTVDRVTAEEGTGTITETVEAFPAVERKTVSVNCWFHHQCEKSENELCHLQIINQLLRVLVALRRINHLLKNDYKLKNSPVFRCR